MPLLCSPRILYDSNVGKVCGGLVAHVFRRGGHDDDIHIAAPTDIAWMTARI